MKKVGSVSFQKKGFTLLEVVLCLGILSLILGVIYTFIWTSLSQGKKITQEIKGNENIYYGLNFMEDEILSAQEIWIIPIHGKNRYVLCQFNPRAKKEKGHFIYYDVNREDELVRVAWKAYYTNYEEYKPIEAIGKNVLCRDIQSLDMVVDQEKIFLKLKTLEGRNFEKILAKRCEVKGQ